MMLKKLAHCLILALISMNMLSAAEEQTFSMIKPGAVREKHIGAIIEKIEQSTSLKIGAIKMYQLSKEQAEAFYAEHKERPFFADLVASMTSGPVVAMVVEGENAVVKLREIVGATDPKKAAPGTIRALFGSNVTQNAIHASDSVANATREIPFFFKSGEIYP